MSKKKITPFSQQSLFYLIGLLMLTTMIILSLNSGNSGDEHFQVDQAERVYNYYITLGEDSSAIHPPVDLQKYYGQSFDNLVYTINRLFGIDSHYQTSHVLNSLSGWLLIFFTGLTAVLIFGWRAGILSMLFMFFSPLILGHSWNNPKDIPFALTYTFSIYILLKFLKELPKKKISTLFFLTIGIASSISIRIGGLIIIPYIFLFSAAYFVIQKTFYTKKGFLAALKTIPILFAVSILGYLAGLIFWPFALESPLKNPIEALNEMTNFEVGLNQLFEGKIQLSKEIEWYYGIKYLLIKSPIILPIGSVLFLFTVLFRKNLKNDYILYSLLVFAFVFPIAYTIYQDSNLYGGCRHLLWTISPIVVLSAGGFDFFLDKSNKYIKYGTIAVIAILFFHPIKHTFKNHPLQYIYYNQLVGGVKGAYGQYEMDYYYHSLREGAEWFIKNELSEDTVVITTNHARITEYYFRNYQQVKVEYGRYYEKGKNEWDYAIWANTHITPVQLENGYWPPKETIYTMDVDGMPVGAVVRRISKEDLAGFNALKQNKNTEAKKHFKNFMAVYPNNEEVLEGYARVMLNERKLDSCVIYADSCLIYNPRQIGAYLLKASALNTQNKYAEALEASDEILKIKEDFAEGHYQRGYALKNLNKPNDAIKAFQKANAYKKEYDLPLRQIGEILLNYRNYKKALEIYDQILKLKANDLYATIYNAKCYHLLNDNKKAEELLKTILQNHQNNFEAVKVKYRIAMNQNDMTNAGRYLHMARNINNNSDLFVLRAMYAEKQNKKEEAIELLNKAIELDPINQEAKNMLKLSQTKEVKATPQKQAAQQETTPQESIMFQKPKKKKASSPIKAPFGK
jgi:tetratricopeptide (TPR) repeat protein